MARDEQGKFVSTLPRYREYNGREQYLELHAHRTSWRLDNAEKTDDDFYFLVECAVRDFEEETGVEVFLLGRGSRHVCVDDCPANAKRYRYLERKAIEYEERVIAEFNGPAYEEREIVPA